MQNSTFFVGCLKKTSESYRGSECQLIFIKKKANQSTYGIAGADTLAFSTIETEQNFGGGFVPVGV